jgi:hypothetical protein
MKKSSVLYIVLFVLLGTMLVSACSTTAPQSVAALAATEEPTGAEPVSPLPAQQLNPVDGGAPTPTRMEFSVENAQLVVKVMDIEKPHQVYLGVDNNLGTDIFFKPGEGHMFLGVGIKVSNLTGADLPFKWTDIYLVNNTRTSGTLSLGPIRTPTRQWTPPQSRSFNMIGSTPISIRMRISTQPITVTLG